MIRALGNSLRMPMIASMPFRRSELFDSLLSVGGFRDQLHVGFSVDQRCDSFAEEGMVVHRENPNHEFVPPSYGIAQERCGQEMSRMQSIQGCSTLSPCLLRLQSTRPASHQCAWRVHAFPEHRSGPRVLLLRSPDRCPFHRPGCATGTNYRYK